MFLEFTIHSSIIIINAFFFLYNLELIMHDLHICKNSTLNQPLHYQ